MQEQVTAFGFTHALLPEQLLPGVRAATMGLAAGLSGRHGDVIEKELIYGKSGSPKNPHDICNGACLRVPHELVCLCQGRSPKTEKTVKLVAAARDMAAGTRLKPVTSSPSPSRNGMSPRLDDGPQGGGRSGAPLPNE